MNRSRIGANLVFTTLPDHEECYTAENYRNLLEEYTAYLEYIGYLEFSHVLNVSPDEAVKLGNHARSLGFEPWSIHSEHLNIGDTLEKYLTIQTHEAEVCAALGCQVMVCHLPNLRPYFDFERDLDVIGQLSDITRRCGIRLAVETCTAPNPENEKEILPDAEFLLRVVETLDRPDVGVNIDTGHCLIGQTRLQEDRLEKVLSGEEEQTLPALFKRVGKKLFTTHLQDNFGMNDDHQAPGFGYIDWEKLIPAILGTGYQGPLMMELTGMGVKARRTVPQLRKYPLEKELVSAAAYLDFLRKKYSSKA